MLSVVESLVVQVMFPELDLTLDPISRDGAKAAQTLTRMCL